MPVQKIKAGRIITVQAETYVGEKGTIFYDENTGVLRLSDGITPGGIIITSIGGGAGINITGYVDTSADLPSSGNSIGDTYIALDSGHLWIYVNSTSPGNINGFIDSGPIVGPRGYTGSQGIIGYTGSVGYTGSEGYTGSQGFTGFIGSRGYTGSRGAIGYTGSFGYSGSQGFIGYSGSQGIAGAFAALGYTGSRGIQGPAFLEVSLISINNTVTNTLTNVTSLRFDSDSGFDVESLGPGSAKVKLNSTFKYWNVDGAPGLVAEALDTVNFIASTGTSIVAKTTGTDKSLTFSVKPATTSTLGGVKIGEGLTINNDGLLIANSFGNLDGGFPDSVYGGTTGIDGGTV